jgi:glycosyltransferase involved in cell wall biosynthesis
MDEPEPRSSLVDRAVEAKQALGRRLWYWRTGRVRDAYARLLRRPDRVPGPLRIAAMFSRPDGISSSAAYIADGLESLGLKVERVDLGVISREVALLDGEQRPGGSWLIVVNAPEAPWAFRRLGPGRLAGAQVAMLWAYELEAIPRSWRREATLAHQLLAPSRFTAEAMTRVVARPTQIARFPVRMAAHDRVAARLSSGLDGRFTAVMVFDMASSAARKNPWGAIEAFRQAFGNDPGARLIVKLQRGDIAPRLKARLLDLAGDGVEIIDEVWPRPRVDALVAGADVLISLHRSEGFGLLIVEALGVGTPVIATDWSAPAELLDPQVAWPVPATLVPIADPQGVYRNGRWADPDIGVAAAALRRIRDDPEEAARRAAAGQIEVRRALTPEAFRDALGPAFWANVQV